MFDDRIGNLQKMLARMGPEGRQRYAADHADDPIAVSMALFVNNIAKEIKEGKRGEPDMPPPVVQQAIQAMNQPKMPQGGPPQGMPPQGPPPQGMPPQGMPPQGMPPQGMPPQGMPPQGPPQGQPQMAADGGYMDSRLPEDMGIGALPERSLSNMADGGIVGYSDGGDIQSFQSGGAIAEYKTYARAKAAKMGVSPALVDTIFTIESGYNPEAKSPTGPVGIGQLTKATGKAYGVSPADRNKPYKNIDASIAFIADLQEKYGNDASKIAVAYNQGEPILDAHLKNNSGSLNPNTLSKEAQEYLKKLNNLLPMASANATETVPTTATATAAAPAAAPKKSIEDRIRETLLSPVDTKPFSEVPRAMVQGLGSQIAGLGMGVAGAVMPGKEGQGADYAKRAEQAVGGYQPTSESSKRILDVLGYLPNKFSEYVSKPVGEAIDKATGSTTAGDIATRISDLVPLFIPGSRKGTTPPKVANVEPVQATAPTPAVRTVPLPKQVAAGNPPAVKPPVAQPPIALPPPEGIERINRATENNAAAKLAAEQEAAAKAGAPPPPNLTPNQKIVPAPKVNVEGGLPSIITPEAAAFKAQAVARAEARAAERAAEKTAEKPVVTTADAVKAAEAAKAAEAQVAAGSRAALQERPAPSNFPKPSVVGAGAVGAGAAATEGANILEPAINEDSVLRGKSGIADLDIGPAQERPSFDRKSGDDTTQFPSITPEIAETAVTLAKAEIPKKEQSGFGYEDLMMFGLQLMAGQSPNALTNVGTAGIAALTAKQARTAAEKKTTLEERKIASDEKKEAAMARYYEKYGNYLESEAGRKADDDKPLAQFRKELAAAYLKLEANPLLSLDPAKMAAAKRQARADLAASYPELAGTMGGAPSAGRVIDFNSIK